MKNNIKNGIYIPDENRKLHPLDEWTKREDPTTAQTVVLVTDSGTLEIAKKDLPGEFNFEGAQKAAAEYREGFRCATRSGVQFQPRVHLLRQHGRHELRLQV